MQLKAFGNSGRLMFYTMLCHGGWKPLDCDCEDPECPPFPVEKISGMMVIDASREAYRLYCCDGGYVGAGQSVLKLVSAGGDWVTVFGQREGADIAGPHCPHN